MTQPAKTALFDVPSAQSFALLPAGNARTTGSQAEAVLIVLENWHNDTHPGAFRTCEQQPCNAVHRVTREHALGY